MSEPKYKVGDWVLTETGGRVFQIAHIAYIDSEDEYYYSGDKNEDDCDRESNISHAIKIIPDYGEVYCKDCKHFRIAYENEKPIFEGCMCLDELMGNFHMMNWRFDPYFSGDTLRPPPNCNCFEPKEENA